MDYAKRTAPILMIACSWYSALIDIVNKMFMSALIDILNKMSMSATVKVTLLRLISTFDNYTCKLTTMETFH